MNVLTSFRTRLIVILCSFLAVTLGTLGFFINDFNHKAIAEQTRDREELFARNVQVSINQVLFAGKYQAQAFLESIAEREPSVRYLAIVEGGTGRVIAHSDPTRVGTIDQSQTARQAMETLQTDKPVAQRVQAEDGTYIHDWALPYERGYLREREGVIRIGLSGEREAALQRQAKVYTLALILLFLVAGVLLAVVLSLRLTSRLTEMAAAASRFGEGRYDALVHVPAQPRDELDQLGVALNQMAVQLGGYAEHLESQVKERTAQLASANRQLREGEARMTAFMDNASSAIYLKDPHGRYMMANPAVAAMHGVPRDQLIGKADRDIQPPEVYVPIEETDQEVLATGRQKELEETMTLANGEQYTFLTVKFPLFDDTGAIYAMGGVSTDITERKRLEGELRLQNEKLRQLDQLKNEFVNAVSHDLRTPLTSILGYTEFLQDEVGGPLTAAQQEFVQQVQLGTRRLETLVDDLLDAARIEAGTFRLRLGPGDLRETAHEIVDSLKPQADHAQLALTLDLPADPLEVVMDGRRLQQVFANLLHNAIKFTPNGGTITVRLHDQGPAVCAEVTDTGPGIAPEDAKKLFQRFSQLQHGMAKGGTGLGLAISRSIIEAHGGTIGVESEPGQGATFWFTLPKGGPPAGEIPTGDA